MNQKFRSRGEIIMIAFNKVDFSTILRNARGNRDNEQYAKESGVSRTYISMYLNMKRNSAPFPEILLKLANVAHNGVSYETLMQAAGYIADCNTQRLAELEAHFEDLKKFDDCITLPDGQQYQLQYDMMRGLMLSQEGEKQFKKAFKCKGR